MELDLAAKSLVELKDRGKNNAIATHWEITTASEVISEEEEWRHYALKTVVDAEDTLH